MVASILKIVITRNTICDNLVGFPKSGHICRLLFVNNYSQLIRGAGIGLADPATAGPIFLN